MNSQDFNRPFYIPSNTPEQETIVYIGQGAGKQINEQIEQAKREIIVISPYISSSYIETLLLQAKKGVSVKVAFHGANDKAENLPWRNKESLRHVVNQHQFTDQAAKTLRDMQLTRCMNWSSRLRTIRFVGLFLTVVGSVWLFKSNNTEAIPYVLCAAGLLTLLLAWIVKRWSTKQKQKLTRTPIYSYAYDTNFEVNCIYNADFFLHSKIYVIDNKVAYLGSVNFTYSGFKQNIETRVCIKHAKTVADLRTYALDLMRYAAANSYSTDILGKALYDEPLY